MKAAGVCLGAGVWICLGLVCLPTVAVAQTAPEKAIRSRQAAFYLMGQQMARIKAGAAGGSALEKSSLKLSAEVIEVLSRAVAEQFPAGSDQGTTKAKPDIWKEPARFKQLMQDLQSQAVKLQAAVRAGDPAEIKAAYGETSRSCKACHDDFKSP